MPTVASGSPQFTAPMAPASFAAAPTAYQLPLPPASSAPTSPADYAPTDPTGGYGGYTVPATYQLPPASAPSAVYGAAPTAARLQLPPTNYALATAPNLYPSGPAVPPAGSFVSGPGPAQAPAPVPAAAPAPAKKPKKREAKPKKNKKVCCCL